MQLRNQRAKHCILGGFRAAEMATGAFLTIVQQLLSLVQSMLLLNPDVLRLSEPDKTKVQTENRCVCVCEHGVPRRTTVHVGQATTE